MRVSRVTMAGALACVVACIGVPEARAGAVCFQACATACCEMGAPLFCNIYGVVLGLTGCAGACMVACAAGSFVPPACFGNETVVATALANNGTLLSTPVHELQPGHQVLTLAPSGGFQNTTVVRATARQGSFPAITLHLQDSSTLTLTANHLMVLAQKKQTDEGKDGVQEDAQVEFEDVLRRADEVRVGDLVRLQDGTLTRVVRVGASTRATIHEVVTAHGTLLADGILTSTLCENAPDDFAGGDMRLHTVLPRWRAAHQYVERSDQPTPLPQDAN